MPKQNKCCPLAVTAVNPVTLLLLVEMDTVDDSSLGMSQCSSKATNQGTATTGDASTVDNDNSLPFKAGEDDEEEYFHSNGNSIGDVDEFKLLTQANDHLQQDSVIDDINGGPSSSSSEESESDSDESSDGDDDGRGPMARGTPIQVRRARNIRRHDVFLQKIESDRNALFGTAKKKSSAGRLGTIAEGDDKKASAPELNELAAAANSNERRGMLLPVSSKKIRAERINPLQFGSLSKELQRRYPHRSTQIVDLVSRLSKIVQKSHFAWEMQDNILSEGFTHFSDAGCQQKLSFHSPLLITGPAGSAKSSIVRDALEEIKCIDRGVAVAYADFAGSEASSLSAVLNIAYKKLYECYELMDRLTGEADKKRRRKHTYLDDFEFIEDEDSGEEELLERRRKGKRRKAASGGEMLRRTKRNTTQLRPADNSSSNANGLNDDPAVKTASKSKQDAASVALFGRAVAELIDEGSSRKKGARRPRTAFLVLDNVDRILEWKRQSVHPLSQLFLMSSVTGLEVILISRSSLYAHTSRKFVMKHLSRRQNFNHVCQHFSFSHTHTTN